MSRGDASIPYPLGVNQTVSYTGTASRTSSGVGGQTRTAAIYASTDCYYTMGNSGVVATAAGGTFLPAFQQHFVKIRSNQYVSFLRKESDGDAEVSEFGY